MSKRNCACGYPLPDCIEGDKCPECYQAYEIYWNGVVPIPIEIQKVLAAQDEPIAGSPRVIELTDWSELGTVPVLDSRTGLRIN